MDNNFDIKKVKVARTTEGTMMETIAGLLLIVTGVIALARRQFDGAMGKEWLMGIIVFSLAIILLLAACYRPKFFKNARKLHNMEQVLLTNRMSRVLAIEFALMVLCNAISGNLMNPHHPVWLWLPIIVILITALFFTILIYKAR